MEVALFLLVTFTLSGAAALLTRGLLDATSSPFPVRLLVASLVYVACMGWQPLLAVWLARRVASAGDRAASGFRPFEPKYAALALFGSGGLAVSAMCVSAGAGWLLSTSSDRDAVSPATAGTLDFELGGLMMAAVWLAVLLMWIQTLAEEVGWRGYFLARSMQLLGPWAGLSLHGAVWGLWYATGLWVGRAGVPPPLLESIGFVVTCSLLGILLGWLRLASQSLAPGLIANCLLTAIAGLPLLLQGHDLGFRSAAYGPAGWLPMGACVLLLAASPLRELVRPLGSAGEFTASTVVQRSSGDRTLH